jgi:hypothetical protein
LFCCRGEVKHCSLILVAALSGILQVNDEVTRYNTVLQKFLDAAPDEWEAIVTVYRGDLQRPFFEHMQVGGG